MVSALPPGVLIAVRESHPCSLGSQLNSKRALWPSAIMFGDSPFDLCNILEAEIYDTKEFRPVILVRKVVAANESFDSLS